MSRRATSILLATLASVSGCIVDDRGGTRGQSNAPAARVPDSGSPIRRESAAETLREADPDAAARDEAGETTLRGSNEQ